MNKLSSWGGLVFFTEHHGSLKFCSLPLGCSCSLLFPRHTSLVWDQCNLWLRHWEWMVWDEKAQVFLWIHGLRCSKALLWWRRWVSAPAGTALTSAEGEPSDTGLLWLPGHSWMVTSAACFLSKFSWTSGFSNHRHCWPIGTHLLPLS